MLQRKVHLTQQGERGSESATTGLHGTSTDSASFEAQPKKSRGYTQVGDSKDQGRH